MDERNAFGAGLRHLRLIRGLPQEAFMLSMSPAHVSVIELGKKLITLDSIGGLAAVLSVHPLTLLTAMYVEYDGLSVRELLSRVQKDFASLAAQPRNQGVGMDSRNWTNSRVDASVQWLRKSAKVRRSPVPKVASELPQLPST